MIFNNYKWSYPLSKVTKNFRGAVQEYQAKQGGTIAVAFTTEGAFVFKDAMGYFGTRDFAGKGGVFSQGDSLTDYEGSIQIGAIYISEDGQSVDDVEVMELPADFEDRDFVEKDIKERMLAVAPFGFFDVQKL